MLLPPLPRVGDARRPDGARHAGALRGRVRPRRSIRCASSGCSTSTTRRATSRCRCRPGAGTRSSCGSERYRGVVEGDAARSPSSRRTPAASSRCARRRRAAAVVGTTAHIGMGALDITSQAFDAASAMLTRRPRAGRATACDASTSRARRARAVDGATLDGAPVGVDGRVPRIGCEVSVDEAVDARNPASTLTAEIDMQNFTVGATALNVRSVDIFVARVVELRCTTE